MKRNTDRCSFCEKELSELERKQSHRYCNGCNHLRRMIIRMGWQNKRARAQTPKAIEKEILSWLFSGCTYKIEIRP